MALLAWCISTSKAERDADIKRKKMGSHKF